MIKPSKPLRIAFTGGGTAGHVNPNLAIIELCRAEGVDFVYLGTPDGIERELVARQGDIPFYEVPSDRLRRYFSWKTLLTPFKVAQGVCIATLKLRRILPHVVFSKGGFAAFPVVVGAWLCRIPVVAHESDITPGLANKMSFPFVKRICTGFLKTVDILGPKKAIHTGSPIRRAFFEADAQRANTLFGLDAHRKTVVVFGGSQGAQHINDVLREGLDVLLEHAQIVHACGPGHLDETLSTRQGYHQHEYIHQGFPDLLARADLVVCRAGANSIAELLALGTPSLLIPLPTASSRGDQWLNAKDFVAQGFGHMLRDEDLTPKDFIDRSLDMLEHGTRYKETIRAKITKDSAKVILNLLKDTSKHQHLSVSS